MSGRVFQYETVIREKHLDAFGHVNNAKYLELFEEARWELITSNGYGLDAILAQQKGPVIFEAHLKFKKELRLREAIRIETCCTDYRKKVGTIIQHIYNQSDEICCSAEFRFGLFDLVARRLIVPTPEWSRAIGV